MPPLLVLAIDGVHVELEVPKGKTKNNANPQDALIHLDEDNPILENHHPEDHNSPDMDHQENENFLDNNDEVIEAETGQVNEDVADDQENEVNGAATESQAPALLQRNVDSRDHFMNRHDKRSINVMLAVGASNRIYECTTSAKGSVHDSKVFKTSGLYKLLTSHKWLPFEGALIVGDSAYPVSSMIIKKVADYHPHHNKPLPFYFSDYFAIYDHPLSN